MPKTRNVFGPDVFDAILSVMTSQKLTTLTGREKIETLNLQAPSKLETAAMT